MRPWVYKCSLRSLRLHLLTIAAHVVALASGNMYLLCRVVSRVPRTLNVAARRILALLLSCHHDDAARHSDYKEHEHPVDVQLTIKNDLSGPHSQEEPIWAITFCHVSTLSAAASEGWTWFVQIMLLHEVLFHPMACHRWALLRWVAPKLDFTLLRVWHFLQ